MACYRYCVADIMCPFFGKFDAWLFDARIWIYFLFWNFIQRSIHGTNSSHLILDDRNECLCSFSQLYLAGKNKKKTTWNDSRLINWNQLLLLRRQQQNLPPTTTRCHDNLTQNFPCRGKIIQYRKWKANRWLILIKSNARSAFLKYANTMFEYSYIFVIFAVKHFTHAPLIYNNRRLPACKTSSSRQFEWKMPHS